jgi:cytochrome c oxidase cbb3-type subunit III
VKLLAIFFLLWAAGAAQSVQPGSSTNPYTTPEDIAAGGRIFRSHCLGCHGRDGTGGRGPNLTRLDLRFGGTDQDLVNTISEGIPGTEMPFFFFHGKQLWQLVAFVQSLRHSSQSLGVKGSTEAGAALFRGKGGCLRCHQVNGEGGRLGPDLSQVGARRSPGHLTTSLLDPGRYISPLDRKVVAITQDGKRLSGLRLNEDTYSLQILDSNERLIAIPKAQLKEYRLDNSSSMPSYKEVLSQGEVDDLVAYLYSLRGKESRQ